MVLALPLVAGTRAAYAQDVAIECSLGKPPADSETLISPVLEVLAVRGYLTDGATLAARIPPSKRLHPGDLPADEVAQVRGKADAARALYRRAATFRKDKRRKYEEAATALEAVWNQARATPAMLTSEDLARDMQAVLVTLAMAHDRAGNRAASRAAIAEYHRSFLGTDIDYDRFGPEPEAMSRELREAWQKQGQGTLSVTTDGSNTPIFIGAYLAGTGSVKRKLFPGTYRVYAKIGSGFGHIHEIEVKAGKQTRLALRTSFERATHIDDKQGVRVVLDRADDARLPELARWLRELLGTNGTVVLVGFRSDQGKASLFGRTFPPRPAKTAAREARIPFRDPDQITVQRLRDLGAFLAGEAPAAGLQVIDSSARPVAAAPSHPTAAPSVDVKTRTARPPRSSWRWGAAAAWTLGATAVGLGVWQLTLDGDPSCAAAPADECPRRYDTMVSGWATVGTGVVLGAAGTWLWLRARPRSKWRVAAAPNLRGDLEIMAWMSF